MTDQLYRIKPLEWVKVRRGTYVIETLGYQWIVERSMFTRNWIAEIKHPNKFPGTRYDRRSLKDAKKFCEADREQQLRQHLLPVDPTP